MRRWLQHPELMMLTRRLWLVAAGSLAPWCAARADLSLLVVLVDNTVQLPQALIKGNEVVAGLQHDIALELGRRLQREVRFRVVPRRRVGPLLEAGVDADLICTYLPAWLPGPFRWSQPFLDDGELLITATRRAAPARLLDVAGHRIGTIAGFEYPDMQKFLGRAFVRDDGPGLEATLRKLAIGRVDHALVGRTSFEYLQRQGQLPVALHPPLVVSRWRTSCALSPGAGLPLAALDAAITAMRSDGTLDRMTGKYR